MFKVTLKNLQKEINWIGEFSSYEEASLWATEQIKRPGRLQEPLDKVIVDVTSQYALEKSKLEAKKYLSDTDWYVIRFMDLGVEIPSDIKLKRQQAREIL
jgi:hypothetical protein